MSKEKSTYLDYLKFHDQGTGSLVNTETKSVWKIMSDYEILNCCSFESAVTGGIFVTEKNYLLTEIYYFTVKIRSKGITV